VNDRQKMVLAADIGATTSRLGIFSSQLGPRVPVAAHTVATADYPSPEALIDDFLAGVHNEAATAALAVAGPVREERVVTDTLPWPIDGAALRAHLGMPTLLLMNDLDAMARAVTQLGPDDVETLREGRPDERGAMAVIGLGTGLGEAFLVRSPSGHVACQSEGGHSAFAPSSELELELLRSLWAESRFVSYEMVCSGMALPDLYAFVRNRSTDPRPDPEALSRRLAESTDPTRVIVDAALDGGEGSATCREAVDLMVGILGAKAGDLALTVNATGGMYLGGGMPSRILPVLRSGRFLERFGSKGRDSAFLGDIPVRVITNTFAGLIGAAASGLELLDN
jgi:glucokinase